MANTITAGNATNNGMAFVSDNTGTLNILTGTGSGTTALSIDASQVSTFAAGVSGTTFSGTTGSFSGNLSFNSGYGSAAVAYGCRAWVNFNGTGTVAIRGSGNVTSITDNGTGDYTVNFTTAMPDANYSVVFGCQSIQDSITNNGNVYGEIARFSNAIQTSSARTAWGIGGASTKFDPIACLVSIFR